MVKKGFNMVKKAFFAFEQPQKPMKNENSCGVAPSENKKSYGGEPSEKKSAFFYMDGNNIATKLKQIEMVLIWLKKVLI